MESHVLVVDDSAAIRKILHRVLRQTGMAIGEIYEAGDGQEALELLKTKTVGLVLSDINMPNMNGLAAGRLENFARAATHPGGNDYHRRRRNQGRRSREIGGGGVCA